MKEVKEAVRALRKQADTYTRLAVMLEKLDTFSSEYKPNRTRHLSAAGRARISKAQKARWQKARLQVVHRKAV